MNQEYRIGDKVFIYAVGHVVAAQYNEMEKRVEYKIRFEDGKDYFGFANVTAQVLTQPAQQVLSDAEVQELRDREIQA